ncbi:MAG: AAA family ATPase [Clostridiales bacterium]|jgi:replicative DNA helicase|nr:AAA family ATPase [Clostridiales bacterium]
MTDIKIPHDPEAEKSVLGSILIKPELLPLTMEYLTPEVFYLPVHRLIYKALRDLFDERKQIDLVSLNTQLQEKNESEQVGGFTYLMGLTEVLTTATIEQHCQAIRDKAQRREQYKACAEAAKIALNEAEYSPGEAAALITEKILGTSIRATKVKAFEAGQVARDRLKAYEENQEIRGVKTGLTDIDSIINCLPNGQLIILAGRPGMGKTQLACDIALEASKDVYTLFVTAEMTKERIVDRMLCSLAGVNGKRYQRRQLTEPELIRVANTASSFTSRKLKIVDRSVTTADIRALCYREKAENGLGLIIIDYLGKIVDKRLPGMNTNDHIGHVVGTLQNLSKDIDAPILLLCQLSRQVEQRKPPVPGNSDLRDSGNIEQDADIIMFVYREEVYTKKRPGEADILVTKVRDGEPGMCTLTFSKTEPRFKNMVRGGNVPWDQPQRN